jgi:hypothetical protein
MPISQNDLATMYPDKFKREDPVPVFTAIVVTGVIVVLYSNGNKEMRDLVSYAGIVAIFLCVGWIVGKLRKSW